MQTITILFAASCLNFFIFWSARRSTIAHESTTIPRNSIPSIGVVTVFSGWITNARLSMQQEDQLTGVILCHSSVSANPVCQLTPSSLNKVKTGLRILVKTQGAQDRLNSRHENWIDSFSWRSEELTCSIFGLGL